MVTEIGGASLVSQIQSAVHANDAVPKRPDVTVSNEPAAEVSKPAELELEFDLEVVERAAETVGNFIEQVTRSVRVAYDTQIDSPIFTVDLRVLNLKKITAKGSSIREAERSAANEAITVSPAPLTS